MDGWIDHEMLPINGTVFPFIFSHTGFLLFFRCSLNPGNQADPAAAVLLGTRVPTRTRVPTCAHGQHVVPAVPLKQLNTKWIHIIATVDHLYWYW